MAIDVHSKRERTYQTWLKESVLSSYVSAYVSYLSEHGYAANTVGFYLHSAAHFVHWLAKRKTGLRQINEGLVQRFITVHLPACDCDRRCRRKADGTVGAALRHLLRVLRLKGGIPAGVGPLPGAVQKELDRFDIYMERVCGLALRTRLLRLHYLGKFLSNVFRHGPIDLALLKSRDIEQFVIHHGEGCTRSSIQVICSCLRTYLRFRAFEGDRTEALIAAVPRIHSWRLASLPKRLTDQELRQFLAAFDRTTVTGKRNYAMARCLVDLGLRAGEVARLRLEHFDWRQGTMQIVGSKGRRADLLPLPGETGRAIVQYLRKARPKCTSRMLFLRHTAPLDRPLTTAIVCWAMRCGSTAAVAVIPVLSVCSFWLTPGGGNAAARGAWKDQLQQQLCDRFGLTVAHYPTGASKYNPIERRLFSHISSNWKGEPLKSYETILKFIRTTSTSTGLIVTARLDRKQYPVGIKPSAARLRQLNLTKATFAPRWNYTIRPSAVK